MLCFPNSWTTVYSSIALIRDYKDQFLKRHSSPQQATVQSTMPVTVDQAREEFHKRERKARRVVWLANINVPCSDAELISFLRSKNLAPIRLYWANIRQYCEVHFAHASAASVAHHALNNCSYKGLKLCADIRPCKSKPNLWEKVARNVALANGIGNRSQTRLQAGLQEGGLQGRELHNRYTSASLAKAIYVYATRVAPPERVAANPPSRKAPTARSIQFGQKRSLEASQSASTPPTPQVDAAAQTPAEQIAARYRQLACMAESEVKNAIQEASAMATAMLSAPTLRNAAAEAREKQNLAQAKASVALAAADAAEAELTRQRLITSTPTNTSTTPAPIGVEPLSKRQKLAEINVEEDVQVQREEDVQVQREEDVQVQCEEHIQVQREESIQVQHVESIQAQPERGVKVKREPGSESGEVFDSDGDDSSVEGTRKIMDRLPSQEKPKASSELWFRR
ncbi:hypothetical protein BT63DRAFT_429736 [Microthyrium microscopicum]|uniref:RRM domain-containing protein n=1 Tax=Microthyrium microscopicum TaxID=703497 RepID=A0A6A6TZW5_9PEZI|nr:hypothetical protein BT63DRAFT_429736 [Microthyrium microscopicum]